MENCNINMIPLMDWKDYDENLSTEDWTYFLTENDDEKNILHTTLTEWRRKMDRAVYQLNF